MLTDFVASLRKLTNSEVDIKKMLGFVIGNNYIVLRCQFSLLSIEILKVMDDAPF
jgi:hypothetical protein